MANIDITKIKDKIHTFRGFQVMLDRDLAELYGVETRNLNKAVKRNIERFPGNFMFQLNDDEFKDWKFQFGTSKKYLDSNYIKKGLRKKPYAFTEQGVAMLSGVLRSDVAVKTSIHIMNAFVAMRKFITSNTLVFNRLDKVEIKLLEHDKSFEKIFQAIENDIKPSKGIFFDGQIFDAHKFVSELIRKAKKQIILVDNYIDDSVLVNFSKKRKNVRVLVYTREVSQALQNDVSKFNKQYGNMEIKEFSDAHDRFLLIDDDMYHFGASLKDLGKKWFGFSRMDKESLKVMDKLKCE